MRVRTFYRAVTSREVDNYRPKNLKRDGKVKLEVEFPVLDKSIPLKKIIISCMFLSGSSRIPWN